ATAGALLLHRAAEIERQTQRVQQLGGLAFQLQDFASRAEIARGVSRTLAADRARALEAASAALRRVETHDREAGRRIRALYDPYVRRSTRAFGAARNGGPIPAAFQRQVERGLARLESRVDAEVSLQEQAMHRTNPEAR